MKEHLVAIVICASTLALLAQQPKVNNTNLTVESVGGTLTATVDRFRQSGEQRWLGYEVPALPQSHFSTCSSDASSMDDEFFVQDTLNGKSLLNRYVWSQIVSSSPHFEESWSSDGGRTWEPVRIVDLARVSDDTIMRTGLGSLDAELVRPLATF
jgi:hypothetical protein